MVISPFVVAIVQARMSSSRLPAKVMLDLCGKTILERVLNKANGSNTVNEIWLATTNEAEDDIIELVGQRCNVKVFRGQSEDVLDRFCNVVKRSKADIIVRITADNPFTESRLIDHGVDELKNKNLDYVAFKNIPYGAGVEVITKEALVRSEINAEEMAYREHVTLFIKENEGLFKVYYAESPLKTIRRPDLSVTIDHMEDYTRLYKIFSHLQGAGKSSITLEDVIYCLDHMN